MKRYLIYLTMIALVMGCKGGKSGHNIDAGDDGGDIGGGGGDGDVDGDADTDADTDTDSDTDSDTEGPARRGTGRVGPEH